MKPDTFVFNFSVIAIPLFLMGCVSGTSNKSKPTGIGLEMPITTITQFVDARQMVLKGKIFPLANLVSIFKLSDGAGINCEGETNNKGDGEMRCTNVADDTSFVVKIDIPNERPNKLYGTFNGAYVDSGTGVIGIDGDITAVGWGNDAVDEKLQNMLAAALR